MPELPEVETIRKALEKQVINKKIKEVKIYWDNIIVFPSKQLFIKQITNQTIRNVKRRGKWLLFELDNYYLLSHLRMEGKYFYKQEYKHTKHDHVVFVFKNSYLIYNDTRKFGKMYLIEKEQIYNTKPLNQLGLEPWDKDLTVQYLQKKFISKLPIKTVLLNQSIIVGIGNIYADEILFASKINPLKSTNKITKKEMQAIIDNAQIILKKAIQKGGTTIKSYLSSEGVPGQFQNELLVHNKEKCPKCHTNLTKIRVGGRTTYYCFKCQK